ncbi:MAG: hypothetical protein QOI48_3033 [Solirubrobacteraceae bacterium]|nr:hypothetical protein [Solirubrobacteraceae bacterium]
MRPLCRGTRSALGGRAPATVCTAPLPAAAAVSGRCARPLTTALPPPRPVSQAVGFVKVMMTSPWPGRTPDWNSLEIEPELTA